MPSPARLLSIKKLTQRDNDPADFNDDNGIHNGIREGAEHDLEIIKLTGILNVSLAACAIPWALG